MIRSCRVLLILSLATPAFAWAQDVRDGDTLPKGAGGLIIQTGLSGGTDRFGPKWRFFGRESILADFAGLDLSQVLAGDGGDAISSGIGSLGITNFQATQRSVGLQFTVAYGITDRLTFAAVLPWSYATYDLEAWLAAPDTTGLDEIEKMNPKYTLSQFKVRDPKAITCPNGEFDITDPDDIFNKLIEPGGDDYKFNVADLNKALTSECLGYRGAIDETFRAGDNYIHGRGKRTYSGFRDLILGAKYQWFHGRNISLSSLLYVIAPTGTPDDPDDLFDPAFGDGQWDAALLVGATIPLGDFRIGAATGYEISFGDTLVRRLNGLTFSDELEGQLARNEISEPDLYDQHLDEGNSLPIVPAYEKALVERKLGNTFYIYSSASYQIIEILSIGVTLDFLHHFRDGITDTGTHVADGTRYKTSAQIRQEVDDGVAAGTILLENREAELKGRLPSSAERKAAAYAWHTERDSIVGGIGLNLNTLGPFLRDEFPLPLIINVGAAIPLGGKNLDAIDSFSLSLVIPFVTGDVKDPAEYGFDDEPDPLKGLPWP